MVRRGGITIPFKKPDIDKMVVLNFVAEVEGKRESEVKVLQDERNSLKQKLEQQRAVIQRFQADEQQRTFQLKAALNNYFTATPKLTDSDVM